MNYLFSPFASFVKTKKKIYYNPPQFGKFYKSIMSRNNIVDDINLKYIRGIPATITPPKYNIFRPFEEWIYKTDSAYMKHFQSFFPDWWDEKETEIECRNLLPEWLESHLELPSDGILKEDNGFYIIRDRDESEHITITGKNCECHIFGISSPDITMSSGRIITYDNSSPIITMTGGNVIIKGNSSPDITVNGGTVYADDDTPSPNIIMNHGICLIVTSLCKNATIIDNRKCDGFRHNIKWRSIGGDWYIYNNSLDIIDNRKKIINN